MINYQLRTEEALSYDKGRTEMGLAGLAGDSDWRGGGRTQPKPMMPSTSLKLAELQCVIIPSRVSTLYFPSCHAV